MQFGKFDFHCTLITKAMLPPYKGSTFRGAFGGCLKRAVCAIRQKECRECLLASRCIYARLFEPKTWQESTDVSTAAPPHPYLIEPPKTGQTQFKAGEHFDFSLLLFGEMVKALPYFVYAFELMGEQGIGKKMDEHRARFSLQGVCCNGQPLYNPTSKKLVPAMPPEEFVLKPVLPTNETGEITIRLITPLRLKQDNHLQGSLDFQLLVRAMLRRVSTLFTAWGSGEPSLDYRGMIARASQVQVVDGRLYWHDWERYSNRQEQSMSFGGILGTVTYRGPLAEYLPLIRLCERLHIGKQTTFGLGRFTVENMP